MTAMRKRNERPTEYRAAFLDLADRWERAIKLTLLVLAALLVAGQAMMHVPALRPWLSAVDRLEGSP